MQSLKFKTNINCSNCVRSVTGFLNDVKNIDTWEVDTADANKYLTVNGQVTSKEIIDAIEDAGFDIEEIKE